MVRVTNWNCANLNVEFGVTYVGKKCQSLAKIGPTCGRSNARKSDGLFSGVHLNLRAPANRLIFNRS